MSANEPRILSQYGDAIHATFELELPADLIAFHGHFEGLPLLPGVVQVHWALARAQQHFHIRGAFLRLTALKFNRVLQPRDRVALHLDWQADTALLQFRYGDEARPYSSGRAHFGAAP